MTQTTEQERAEFEAWMGAANLSRTTFDDYKNDYVDGQWQAWQAARRAQVVPQSVIDKIVPAIDPEGLCEEKHHCEWALYKDRERIRRELSAAPQPTEAAPVQMPEADFYGFRNDEECRVDMCFSPASPRLDGVFAMGYYSWPKVRQLLTAHGVK